MPGEVIYMDMREAQPAHKIGGGGKCFLLFFWGKEQSVFSQMLPFAKCRECLLLQTALFLQQGAGYPASELSSAQKSGSRPASAVKKKILQETSQCSACSKSPGRFLRVLKPLGGTALLEELAKEQLAREAAAARDAAAAAAAAADIEIVIPPDCHPGRNIHLWCARAIFIDSHHWPRYNLLFAVAGDIFVVEVDGAELEMAPWHEQAGRVRGREREREIEREKERERERDC